MATLVFQRTNSGKATKSRFVKQKILYVEGIDDVSFFIPLAQHLSVRCEPAYGKTNILELANKLLNGAKGFSIVLDADLDDFLGSKIVHPAVYYLPCYSVENLAALDEVVDQVAAEYCGRSGVGSEAADELLAHMQLFGKCYYDVVVYDIATRMSGAPNSVIPDHCDVMFGNKPAMSICGIWQSQLDQAVLGLGAQRAAVEVGLSSLSPYSVVMTYLRGHIIFGLLRRLFTRTVKTLTGQKPNVDNKALLRMFSDVFWRNQGQTAKAVSLGVSTALV